MDRIAILGLGLIGGSLGLALKAGPPRPVTVVGFDIDPHALRAALDRGAIDEAAPDLAAAVRGAGLVVVAAPPLAVEGLFIAIAPHLAPGAAVTDTASTKARVMEWAAHALPARVSFIGGHPMAGKSDHGIAHAEAGLFRDRPYLLIPGPTATEEAVAAVGSLVRGLGARDLFLDAEEHDRLVAAVSHLPLAASTALFTLLRGSPGWRDFARLAGPAFRDLTRLASGDPQMAAGIVTTNRENVQYWIDRYIVELQLLRDLFDGSPDAVAQEFARAQQDRAGFLAGEEESSAPSAEPPGAGFSIGGLLFGAKGYDRLRKLAQPPPRPADSAGPP